jgi:UDP-GlcNAc:undecaprenyl-phosphate/decaprenyl-phosphate GlcNAc-1-phosphate transferase
LLALASHNFLLNVDVMNPDLSAIYLVIRALLVSLVLVMVLGWVSIRIAWRMKLIDHPGSAPHKLHLKATPLAGGIALVLALLVGEFFLGSILDPSIRATYLAVIPVFLFGLWDDYKVLSPPAKLLGQALGAVILIACGVSIRIFESPGFFFSGTSPFFLYLDWLITILWVVGITNAFNFVDSMDGLAVGLGGMAAAFYILLTLDSGQFFLAQHSALIVGVCMGLYFYNAPPALLFLGDSGAQSLGLILAALAIAYRPQVAFQTSSWLVPVILLAVPIFDALLVIVSRLRRGRPIYSAARDHTYHRLMELVESPNRAVLMMQMAAFGLNCLAFLGLNQPPLQANLIFMITFLLGVFALLFLDRRKFWV